MLHSYKSVGIFLFLILLFPVAAQAKKSVALGEVTGTGVDQDDIDSVRSLLYSEITAHPKARYDDQDYKLLITGEITRLRRSYILTVFGTTDDGTFSEKAKLQNFDEIDVAAKRLVAAIIEDKSVEQTAERGEVLEEEQEEPTRVRSIQGWEIGFGGAVPLTDAFQNRDPFYVFSGGYFFDVRRFFIELRGDFQIGYNDSSKNLSTLTIGGHYFFHNARSWSSYFGLEAGFGGAVDESFADSTGFVGAADVGVMLLRQTDINIDLRWRTSVLANKLNGEVPVTSALMIGVVFSPPGRSRSHLYHH